MRTILGGIRFDIIRIWRIIYSCRFQHAHQHNYIELTLQTFGYFHPHEATCMWLTSKKIILTRFPSILLKYLDTLCKLQN